MIKIQVAGPGCPNCKKLESMCRDIVAENGIEAEIEKVEDFDRITELGVMLTPGLVIDGTLKSNGKIPTKSTLAHWVLEAAKEAGD